MHRVVPHVLKADNCRWAMRLAYQNGGLWAAGNGLVGTTLITYLAQELGAAGLAVGWILAAPRLAGLLRMATPRLIELLGDRRRFCLATYAVSCVVLFALPLLSAPGRLPSRSLSLTALVLTWSGYHLLEYCGTVALTAWLGDLCPPRLRGRFFGHRERWLTLGRIVGMLLAGWFTWWWTGHQVKSLHWLGYALAATVGAFVMLCAIAPLFLLPNVSPRGTAPPAAPSTINSPATSSWRNCLAPLANRPFRRLLLFGVLFSTVNGITQSAQGIFPYRVLSLHLAGLLTLEAVMRLGQGAISPHLGRWIDLFGNRPVMIVSQVVVACGPLFYLLATPSAPAWIVGAYACFIAYAGINIGLNSLCIKLSPPGEAASYLAAWFGITGVVSAVSTIAGGMLFDALGDWRFDWSWSGSLQVQLNAFVLLFALGAAGRLLAAWSLCWLIEPGAKSLRELGRRVEM